MHMVKTKLLQRVRVQLQSSVPNTPGRKAAVAIATADSQKLVVQIFHGANSMVSGNDLVGNLFLQRSRRPRCVIGRQPLIRTVLNRTAQDASVEATFVLVSPYAWIVTHTRLKKPTVVGPCHMATLKVSSRDEYATASRTLRCPRCNLPCSSVNSFTRAKIGNCDACHDENHVNL